MLKEKSTSTEPWDIQTSSGHREEDQRGTWDGARRKPRKEVVMSEKSVKQNETMQNRNQYPNKNSYKMKSRNEVP